MDSLELEFEEGDDTVLELATHLSVITLDKPVKFNHAENDPVKLIVMLLSNHNTAHIKVLEELVDVLGDARKREAIEAAASAYELLSIIS